MIDVATTAERKNAFALAKVSKKTTIAKRKSMLALDFVPKEMTTLCAWVDDGWDDDRKMFLDVLACQDDIADDNAVH